MPVHVLLGLILFLIIISYCKRKNKSDFPMYPGALPIIGNAHILLGDNVHVFNTMKKITVKLLENGGYLAFLVGPFKYIYVLADPDDCATALNACLEKHYVYSFMKLFGGGLVTADAPTWKKDRKLLHPMFGLQQVRRYLPVFNLQARRLVERLTEHENKGAFNPEPHVYVVSFETICHTTFGADLFEYTTKSQKYVESIDCLANFVVTRFQKLWLHSEFIFNWTYLRRKQDEYMGVINKISNELIQNRKSKINSGAIKMDEEKISDFQPFVDKVIKTALDNEGFTDEKIKDELNTIVAAGYDTTAISIIYCLLLLGHHQDVQDKLCRELKQVFCDSEREVENEDIAKLVYLEAVLKETFRLYPVVPVVARHTDVDLKLKKHTIPAGCDVFVVTYAVNRHPMWGPDAEQFRPERWLDGTAPTNHNLFASFGLGRRGCIGKTYNMLSMKTTISHVVRRFRITADISKLVLQQDMLLKPASGQHIILEPRKD